MSSRIDDIERSIDGLINDAEGREGEEGGGGEESQLRLQTVAEVRRQQTEAIVWAQKDNMDLITNRVIIRSLMDRLASGQALNATDLAFGQDDVDAAFASYRYLVGARVLDLNA
ncbi:hypothetical protein HDV00_009713 [Rhizophlyctis rosea]|nr:hypothetical protein HDV00_009713 [Rhizophlyctis rosea]